MYPLTKVTLREVKTVRKVEKPLYSAAGCQVNGSEFAMQTEGVGCFYACNGNEVEYAPAPGADPDWVSLYLNGQVLVALLHQRRMINFHASSFISNGRGIMILGETGAGKSSLTTSFILNDAVFLTDDLTPVIFNEETPYIMPLFRAIKLRDDTIKELDISRDRISDAEAGTGKYYLHVEDKVLTETALNIIFKIGVGDVDRPEFVIPSPAEKFSLLRSEICSWEMLAGMPATEAEYLRQLLLIVSRVQIIRVVRPEKIEIAVMNEAIRRFLRERSVEK